MSRLTSLTIALASAFFLSVPHLAVAAGDDQRARARGQSGRTASAPAQTQRGGARRAPARSGGSAAKSAPNRRAPAARSGGRTAQSSPPSRPRRAPVTRSGERQPPSPPAARSGARTTQRQTAQTPSRRAPVVRTGGRVPSNSNAKRPETSGATDVVRRVSRRPGGTTSTTSSVSSTRARRRQPATPGVTRTTQDGRGDSRTTTRQRVAGAAQTEAAATAGNIGTVVRRRPSRIVDVNGTRQSESARGAAVRVGSTTRGRAGVRRAAVAEAGSVVQVASARPNRRLSGQGNVVGRAIPRPALNGAFRGSVGSRGRGYSSGYGTTSSYGYRYPYDGGRVRFGRSGGFYGRGHHHDGFNLGISFGSVSLFGHRGYGGYGRYGYPGHGYYSYGYPYSPYYPYAYTSQYYGQSYANPYMGSLRLKVKPRDAEVLVDGYYVGLVDHFDGFAQRLRLEEGTYHIEIRHPDYLPIDLDVLIVAGETVTFEEYMARP